jgi:hypothetical protein
VSSLATTAWLPVTERASAAANAKALCNMVTASSVLVA